MRRRVSIDGRAGPSASCGHGATRRRVMRATMMDYPLTLTQYLERAGTLFRDSEIVHPPAGQVAPPLPLRRLPPARAAARLGAQARRPRAGRSRRHHDVEQLPRTRSATSASPAPGGVLHTPELPPAPERHRLYRQPRRRPLRDRGRRVAAAFREGPGPRSRRSGCSSSRSPASRCRKATRATRTCWPPAILDGRPAHA